MKGSFWDTDIEVAHEGELAILEEKRLQEQMAWVMKHSPFYADKFKDFDPASIKISMLSSLPFTTKKEVRASQEQYPPLGAHACVGWKEINRLHASSGTTGKPTLVGATNRDREMWQELVARSTWAMGCRPESRAWVALAFGWWIAGLSFYEGLQYLGAAVLPSGNNEPARTLSVLKETGVDFVMSTPSFITYLARLAQDELNFTSVA